MNQKLRQEQLTNFVELKNLERAVYAKNSKIQELQNEKCASSLILKRKKEKCKQLQSRIDSLVCRVKELEEESARSRPCDRCSHGLSLRPHSQKQNLDQSATGESPVFISSKRDSLKQNMAEFENDMLKAMIDAQRVSFERRESELLEQIVS